MPKSRAEISLHNKLLFSLTSCQYFDKVCVQTPPLFHLCHKMSRPYLRYFWSYALTTFSVKTDWQTRANQNACPLSKCHCDLDLQINRSSGHGQYANQVSKTCHCDLETWLCVLICLSSLIHQSLFFSKVNKCMNIQMGHPITVRDPLPRVGAKIKMTD